MSPYFDALLNNNTFRTVSEATIDPTLDSNAVELVFEYMYIGDPNKPSQTDIATKLAMTKFADFTNPVDIITLLINSIKVVSLNRKTIGDVPKNGLGTPCAKGVVELAGGLDLCEMEELHNGGPLDELLGESQEANRAVMEGTGRRVKSLKQEHSEQ